MFNNPQTASHTGGQYFGFNESTAAFNSCCRSIMVVSFITQTSRRHPKSVESFTCSL